MTQGRSRWLLRLGLLAVVGLALLLWSNRERPPHLLTIQNRSGQPVALLQVTVAGETKTFKDVPPGAEVTAPTRGEARFALAGRLADGTLLRGQFGDVGERRRLIVLPGGQLVFRQGDKS